MKIMFAVFVLMVMSGSVVAEGESAGRYQLVCGIVELIGKGGVATQEHVIIRIDTNTGRTWEYAAGVGKDGKFMEFWDPILDKTLTGN